MQKTILRKRWFGEIENPTQEQLRAAISDLDEDDKDNPDCSLATDDGWHLVAFSSGKIVLENLEENQGPWHIQQITREDVFVLWNSLQTGDMDNISKRDWVAGYGE